MNVLEIQQKLQEFLVRTNHIIWVPVGLHENDAFEELVQDELDLVALFPNMPEDVRQAIYEDDQSESLIDWLLEYFPLGIFLVQFQAAVESSWGHYREKWFYGETIEEAALKALDWTKSLKGG